MSSSGGEVKIGRTTRERLFEAALGLFSTRGYRETSVGEIERAAGLTPRAGGFYRHFASKEQLLVEAVRRMADEMVASLAVSELSALGHPRSELLVIARGMLRHAAAYRPTRLLLQREGHKLPALAAVARQSNARLAEVDLMPWIENVQARRGVQGPVGRDLALLIFGPIVTLIFSIDRGDPAFGVETESFLAAWADHWGAWLEGPHGP
jgi:AcrR family transcriptional regulator